MGSIPGDELGVGMQLRFPADERNVAREPGLFDRGSARADVVTDGRASGESAVLEQLFAARLAQVWEQRQLVRRLVPVLAAATRDAAAQRGEKVSSWQALREFRRRLPCLLALAKPANRRNRILGGSESDPWVLRRGVSHTESPVLSDEPVRAMGTSTFRRSIPLVKRASGDDHQRLLDPTLRMIPLLNRVWSGQVVGICTCC